MTEEIEKILKDAENLMRVAENSCNKSKINDKFDYYNAIYNGIKAVYEQNRAIIMLLKDKK